jgi:hypothetical protein
MIKYDNIDLLQEEIGDDDNKAALILEGEPMIDAYNSGNKSILNRFSRIETSELILGGEEAKFDFTKETLENFPKEIDSSVGKVTMFVDKFTGLVYTLVIQDKESQLFFHNNNKVVIENFETRAEGSDEVVFTVKAPLWKKLVEGSWIVDDDMRPLTDVSIATSLTNHIGE